ncbi:MAG: ABC transporter permease [bacterium]|nr:ABC transporter permease [bacterium]
MSKILRVAIREFVATVATKAFIIGLVILPVILLVVIVGMRTLMTETAPRIEGEIAVIDPTGEVFSGLHEYLQPEALAERRDDFKDKMEEQLPEGLELVTGTPVAEEARRQALDALLGEVPRLEVVELEAGTDLERAKDPLRRGKATQGGRLALVVVHDDAVVKAEGRETYGRYDLFVRSKLDDRLEREIRGGMWDSIVDVRVRHAGLDRETIESLTRVGRVRSTTVTEEGEKQTNEVLNALLPGAFILLLFVSVLSGGQGLMTSTIEEKSSRVVELMLSAVSPMQLMAGKILGQMCVGFVFLAVYGGMGFAALITFAMLGVVDVSLVFYLVIFYLIAYCVIASLLGSVGAAVNEPREAQGLMGPIMMTLMIPWVLWMPISRDPDSTFALVTSFLPPISPFVMLIRMSSTSPPPLWQVWVSIAIGVAAAYGALWFAAKVFRIGLLMYGKPPNFRTLIRWVRMA